MAHWIKVVKREVMLAIPAIIFFVIAFNLITFTERLIERANDLNYTSYLKATVGALLVGKCLIIINSFRFIEAFSDKPLIYNITWKFFIYGFAVLLFRVAEDFSHSLFFYESTRIAVHLMMEKLASPVFWAIQMWLLMLFAVFVLFSDLSGALGEGKMKKMLFGQPEGGSA